MAIKAAIRNLIVNDATLAALVGTRVSPRIAKTGDTLPRVAYVRTNVDDGIHLTGTSNLRIDSFTIGINSNSSDEGDTIAFQIKSVLEAVLNQTEDSTFIRRCIFRSQSEGEYFPEGREKPIYDVTQNWDIVYNG
jgi:hypothetical protein